MKVQVGDKVYYNGPKGTSTRPEYTVLEIYDDGRMANVRHDNGHVYMGYHTSKMRRADGDPDKALMLEQEIYIAEHLGYIEIAECLREKLSKLNGV